MKDDEIFNEVYQYLNKDVMLSNILSSYNFSGEDVNYLKSLIILLYLYKYVKILDNKYSLFSNEHDLRLWIFYNILNFKLPNYCKTYISFKHDIADKEYSIKYNKECPSSYTIFENSTFVGEILNNEFNKDKYFYIRNDFILDTLGNTVLNIFNFKIIK